MDINVLIDAIVRQTTVLIAQLATAEGGRAPLANTANQVFLDLVRELKSQGLGNKVIADMFGIALRTYHSKVQRLAESTTFRGKSLWEAMIEFLDGREFVPQHEILGRFRNDDEGSVRGVLTDLVDSGIVSRTGRGAAARYRAVRTEELAGRDDPNEDAAEQLVWVAVSRFGPATLEQLGEAVPLESGAIEVALSRLSASARIERFERDGVPLYRTSLCLIPLGTTAGWEAAVFDHYQAVVTAICAKLRKGKSASSSDRVGGSTFALTVWDGHPHYEEAMGQLARMRAQAIELRTKVSAYNEQHPPPERSVRVLSYLGQTLLESDEGES